LFIFIWGTEGHFLKKLKENGLMILLFSMMFWVYLGGLIHTENMNAGIFDLVLKFSFLAFPFIFGVMDFKILNPKSSQALLQFFVGFTFFSALLCLINASNLYLANGQVSSFFYADLSYILHPSYFSLYINFTIGIIFWQIFNKRDHLSSTVYIIYLILFPFFVLFIILLESKAGLIGLVALLMIIAFYIAKYQGNIKRALIFLLASGLFIFIIFQMIPNSTQRINSVVESVSEENSTAANHSVASTRLYLWEAAWDLVQKNPIFGVGTGDVKDELMKQYEVQDNTRAIGNNYNPHNQYLQSTVALGLFGLLSLLFTVLYPIYYGFKKNEMLFLILGVLMAINILVESMFERQAGVMFFAFFNSFIYPNL